MTFQYKVRDPTGRIIDGELDADSAEDATQQLRRDGFQVLTLQEGEDSVGTLFARHVSKRDIIYTTTQLAIMVETGITLSSALDGIIAQEKNPTLKHLLNDLKEAVQGGEDFSAAIERHPKYFDKTYVALVRASEATGTLGEMLDRIATYLRKQVDNRSKVRAAMAYPAVMLVVAIAVTIFLLTYVLPKFTPLFTKKGMKLPRPTAIMMAISSILMDYWYFWLGGAVVALVVFFVGRRTERGAQAWDWFKLHVPILGPMFRKIALSRSVHTLGTMIAAGVSVLESLRLSGEVAGNWHYEQLWKDVRVQVTSGKQICEALANNPLIPPMLVQMISSGEQTGKLDVVLEKVSTYYDREVESAIKTATSLIEPIMICAMGVVVGGIGLALMLPIFSLSRQPG